MIRYRPSNAIGIDARTIGALKSAISGLPDDLPMLDRKGNQITIMIYLDRDSKVQLVEIGSDEETQL